MAAPRGVPESRYFRLDQLAEGVYAAIVVPGTGAWGNAGIVDLGDAALVFDTFLTPVAARELRTAAETLTSSPVRYAVNSHYHMDHTYGNAEFPDAVVIATEITRDLIAERGQNLLERVRADTHPESGPLGELAAAIHTEPDEAKRADMAADLGEWRALHRVAPQMTLRLPDVTFTERLVLYGSRRSAELLSYGGGHTPSDAFLYLANERIAFMGDLVPVRTHPSFAGDAAEWLRILERVEQLPITKLVPGHGQVGTADEIGPFRRYIAELTRLGERLAADGIPADEFLAITDGIPEVAESWTARNTFARNVAYFVERAHEATKSQAKVSGEAQETL